MSFSFHLSSRKAGFTLAEVLIAVVVTVIFGVSVFATNARLMIALKTQRETTAASMMLQERMEALRSLSYTGLSSTASSPSASPSPSPPTYTADVVADSTVSEAQLGGGINATLTETITVSGYMDTNVGALIDHMRELLRVPAEARRLGEGARRYAQQRFNIRRFARDWDDAFAHVVGTGDRGLGIGAVGRLLSPVPDPRSPVPRR